jgi:hypothetical protein
MRNHLLRNATLLTACLPFALHAQIEAEPNNSDAAANTLAISSPMLGAMGSACTAIADDTDDYFVVNVPIDCTLRITTVSNNPTAATHNLNIDVRRNGALLFTSDRVTGNNGNDSIVTNTHHCIAKGTYHLRLWRAFETCYQYSLTVTLVAPLYADDAEPNDDFASAALQPVLPAGTPTEGRVAYTYGSDADDRYRIVLADEGTITVSLNASRDGDIVGHSMLVDLYKDGESIWNMQGVAGVNNTMQLTQGAITCLSAGTYYLGVRPYFGCGFSYRLRYDLAPPLYANDPEPNNNATQADARPVLAANTWREGHFNFNYATASGADDADWFRIETSGDGALGIETEALRDGIAGTMLVNVFRNGTQINSFTATVGGGSIGQSAAQFPCYGAGTYHIALQPSNYCGISYRLRYTLVPPVFGNDLEDNGGSDLNAAPIQPGDAQAEGHLNFTLNGENDDRWRISLTADGAITLLAQAEKADPGTGNIGVTLHNNAGSTVAASNIVVGGGSTPASTSLSFPGLSAGQYVLRLTASNGCGISYRLSCADADSDGQCDGFGQIVGLAERAAANTLLLYPNPVEAALRLRLPADGGAMATVLDATGRVALRERLAVTGGQAILLVDALPPGCYLLRIEGPSGPLSSAFIKE